MRIIKCSGVYMLFALIGTLVSAAVVAVTRLVGKSEVVGFVGGLVVGLCLSVALAICLAALRPVLKRVLPTLELEAFGVSIAIGLLGTIFFLGTQNIIEYLGSSSKSAILGFSIGTGPLFLLLVLWEFAILAELFSATGRNRHSQV